MNINLSLKELSFLIYEEIRKVKKDCYKVYPKKKKKAREEKYYQKNVKVKKLQSNNWQLLRYLKT